MSHLLALSIGPVQEFIAAARRTADLQAGSELLVEIAKAAAAVVAKHGTLIFPAHPELDGPNKILAIIPKDDPADVARKAKEAARERLRTFWEDVKRDPKLRDLVHWDRAERQIDQFLEFYAAWVPQGEDYATARKTVDRLLAGRKALREFRQPEQVTKVPKSPLDPARDCVLRVTDKLAVPKAAQRYPLWLKHRETLDAVSILKRHRGVTGASGRVAGTPSTSLMAARSVLPEREEDYPEPLRELAKLAAKAGSGVDLGAFLFPERLKEVIEEDKLTDEELARVGTLRKQWLKSIGRGETPPYFAVLVADGDRMGKLLGQQDSDTAHRRLSELLHDYGKKVAQCVPDHQGHLVYSGGDDVMALLPVHRALPCAAELARQFRETVQKLGSLPPANKGVGTLSVGIAIVHYLEPLLESIEHARQAERAAKERRNSLAVALHTRGGAPVTACRPWPADYGLSDWEPWIREFQPDLKTGGSVLARGLPYELVHLAREFEEVTPREGNPVAIPAERLRERLLAEARRILGRKKGRRERSEGALAEAHELPTWLDGPEAMRTFAHLLVIARFLAPYGRH